MLRFHCQVNPNVPKRHQLSPQANYKTALPSKDHLALKVKMLHNNISHHKTYTYI